ncbi:MAG: tRNA (guanosine(46)-N7)-methyltransferase TrmB [Mycoplasmatales bacterium]|nr:tRNA (guanosine(46)-N7)-methyltransferase TrmB [Mycoplasmatales bacterium]
MRLRNNPNAMSELEESKYLIKNFPFKLNSKTVLELGMGKGDMLTSLAKNNPELIYIGLEKFATVANIARKKAELSRLENINIVVDDVKNIPSIFIGKTETIWLTFSDPWPKNRHAKRRLTHMNFINIYKKILDKNGTIKFKTDNDKFFEWTVEHLRENGIKMRNITRDFHSHKSSIDNIKTEYEIKWSSLGKKINYLEIYF